MTCCRVYLGLTDKTKTSATRKYEIESVRVPRQRIEMYERGNDDSDDSDDDDDDNDDREDRGAVGHRTPQTQGDGHLPAQINITCQSR